jgi:hypothetical protein
LDVSVAYLSTKIFEYLKNEAHSSSHVRDRISANEGKMTTFVGVVQSITSYGDPLCETDWLSPIALSILIDISKKWRLASACKAATLSDEAPPVAIPLCVHWCLCDGGVNALDRQTVPTAPRAVTTFTSVSWIAHRHSTGAIHVQQGEVGQSVVQISAMAAICLEELSRYRFLDPPSIRSHFALVPTCFVNASLRRGCEMQRFSGTAFERFDRNCAIGLDLGLYAVGDYSAGTSICETVSMGCDAS